jgi:cytochrome c-type biogenesis protein CcmH
MNITFWALTSMMLLLAIGLLVFPLLKAGQRASVAYKESNLKINDDKIEELNQDLAEGRIDQDFYKLAREELDRELLLDIPAENRDTAAQHYVGTAKRHPLLALLVAIFVPMLALLLYLDLGMHAASDESFVAEQKQTEQVPSIEEMAVRLEQKIEQNGGTVEDWTMLGRAHKYLGKNVLAEKAFEVALEQDENNAQLMLELAEVVALNNDRKFTEKSRALVLKAYELEPDNPNALWFVGVAEYQAGNYHEAISHLVTLLPAAAGEEDVMKSIVTIVARSREQLIAAGEEMPELEELLGIKEMMRAESAEAEPAVAVQPGASAAAPAAGRRLQVAVDVSDDIRQKFSAGDSVFVYAKASQGPRMPLAVQRMTLADLPATVVLDDSMAMVAGMSISAFDELVISARISRSGSAIAQSGDYIGEKHVDKSMEAALSISIDAEVP